jgi:High potential iron-sulfur protein
MPSTRTLTRRRLIKHLALAAGTAAMLPALRVAAAGSAPHLDVKDPAAVALGYTEKAALVDAKKFPSYDKGSSCENCAQLQGTAGASYRPCTLFPGKLVAVAGWCSGWAPEI